MFSDAASSRLSSASKSPDGAIPEVEETQVRLGCTVLQIDNFCFYLDGRSHAIREVGLLVLYLLECSLQRHPEAILLNNFTVIFPERPRNSIQFQWVRGCFPWRHVLRIISQSVSESLFFPLSWWERRHYLEAENEC